MKCRYFLSAIIIICFLLSLISCSKQVTLKPDTPVNAAIAMKDCLNAGNYESFNNLFTDGRKNAISIEQFNELRKLTDVGTDFKHYELLTFTNGKMMLITLTQDKENGEYKIEDVKEVPEEMKPLFK